MKILKIHSPDKLKLTKTVKNVKLKYLIKTNPGLILHKKENDGWIYYLSYRYYACGNPKQDIKNPKDIGTPWMSSFKCKHNATGLAMIKINKNLKLTVLSDLINEDMKFSIEDTRLFNWHKDIYALGNMFTASQKNNSQSWTPETKEEMCQSLTKNFSTKKNGVLIM